MLTDGALNYCSPYDREVLSQIEERVVVNPETECWVWPGLMHGDTPVRMYQGKRTSIRRIIHRLLYDPDAKIRLTNTCMTRGCVNPDHMEPWSGPDHGVIKDRILSVDDRAEIMATPATYGTGVKLAKRFGVSPSLVSKIRRQVPNRAKQEDVNNV